MLPPDTMFAMKRGGLWTFLISGALSSVFIINLCNAVYRCGCRSLWAGGSHHCNIHIAGVKHCPWCSIGAGGFALVLGVIVGSQLGLSIWPKRWHWPVRLAVTALAFPLVGTLVALAVGWFAGYWAD